MHVYAAIISAILGIIFTTAEIQDFSDNPTTIKDYLMYKSPHGLAVIIDILNFIQIHQKNAKGRKLIERTL